MISRILILLVSFLSVFNIIVFFITSALFGFEYHGKDDSPVYVVFLISIFGFSFLLYLITFYKKVALYESDKFSFIMIYLFLTNHLFWAAFDPETSILPSTLIFFISIGLPGLFTVRILNVWNLWGRFIRITEIFVIIMAAGLLFSTVLPFIKGTFMSRGIGGATYQVASYYAAFLFGLLGFYTFRLDKHLRLPFLRSKLGWVLNISLMLTSFIVTIINGGRGAFILLVTYFVLLFYWNYSKTTFSISGLIKKIAVIMVFSFLIIFSINYIRSDPVLASGFNRATAFISLSNDKLIDLERGGSGREWVYTTVVNAVYESPVIGYGAFGHWEKIISPHNIFLDLALQFGIPASIIMIFLTWYCLRYSFKVSGIGRDFLIIVGAYPLIMLMFSGGYFQTSLFWFTLLGLMSIKTVNKSINVKS